ncbi:multidrug effflux MFS transporter [Pontixanthobacter gangjinensis]|uniref:Bcr/CflA family efflux transporter n=1 Tax=Pontixanthobacter gangjinensis TaxID=1028742 RepID=A0A6I4SM27_9SPHN|nr:multidrug effflux MFS transporter [Pontixanthobacter gangjinensis]MXO56206.1 Bcr/CflA family efflux MFS transporter [Pontixanthobacter gangjinensis]
MSETKPSQRPAIGERELIVLMALLMSLQAFGIDAMLPALGEIAGGFGMGGNDRQLVISAYFLGAGIGAFFPGAFADKFGRRPVLFFGLICYITLSIACAMATDFWWLIGMRLVQGLGAASLSVVPAAIVRDRVGGDRMARLMSLIMMIFLVVPIVAPAIGQLILMFVGWRWIFGAMAVMGLIVGTWVWIRLPESLAPENAQEIHAATILRNMGTALVRRDSIGYVVGSALVFGSLFGFLNSSQQLIGEAFGAGRYFALIFGAAVLGMVAANFTNSRIVERFGARRVSHTALFAFAFISCLQLWSSSQPDQSLWQFVPLLSMAMATMGFIGANFSSIAMQPFHQIAGAASSAQTSLRMITGALLGAFIGNLYDGTARPLAASMLSCALLALAFILYSEHGKLFRRVNAPRAGDTKPD